MSGGHWNYKNGDLESEMFGWHMSACYGDKGFSQAGNARAINPLRDRELSELMWDMFCILDSADYYFSGDTNVEQYDKDVEYFKNKWLHRTDIDTLNAYKNDLRIYCEELCKEITTN